MKAVVCGMGISGSAAAAALLSEGYSVLGVDSANTLATPVHFQGDFALKLGLPKEHMLKVAREADVLILSPGVHFAHTELDSLRRLGVLVKTEIEYGLSHFNCPVVAVTGSNGKSTTAFLISQLLELTGIKNELVGNIGRAVSTLVGSTPNFLVVEISSYQLEYSSPLKLNVGVITNITENHLEHHKTFSAYRQAKLKLFDNVGVGIINGDDPALAGVSTASAIKQFATHNNSECQLLEGELVFKSGTTLSIADFKLVGAHNKLNLAAACLAASEFVPLANLQAAIPRLTPLEHRLEEFMPRVINDSKATTVTALTAALKAVHERNPTSHIILMCGGQIKSAPFEPAFEFFAANWPQKTLVCFGQDAHKIAKQVEQQGIVPVVFDKLAGAIKYVQSIKDQTSNHSVILFSPGAASFDEFSGFEERGRVFKSRFIQS